MYSRIIKPLKSQSFFLFGPRGTGKSTWVKEHFAGCPYFDLLNDETYSELIINPTRLESRLSAQTFQWVVIDEVQKLPKLLDEVHRLIETRKWKFVLTGSSARKLKREGSNLLAGRALTSLLYPLTAQELGKDFNIQKSLKWGHLPNAYQSENPKAYLSSYIGNYLREEVQQEALVRNLDGFTRFLQAASFSQASQLSIKSVAEDCGIARKTVEGYFDLVEDLLLGARLSIFQRRAKRKLAQHPKFYFFDCGVYRALRPQGPLDPIEEVEGPAIETLVFQELRALNAYLNLGYSLYYWRTADKKEIDFVLYGENGLIAIEVKRSSRFKNEDVATLAEFKKDYPEAHCILLYLGNSVHRLGTIDVLPLVDALKTLPNILNPKT